jgi:hypothetical protein
MCNNDQQLVDHLYNAIFVQYLRCNYFNFSGQQPNSVWNKHTDEKKILDTMVNTYKNFYKTKVEKLKTKLNDIKENNINSYLTYDKEFYVNEYTNRIKELDKYLIELDARTFVHIANDKLSSLSEALDLQFPGYLVNPTLLGQLC